MKNVIFPLVPTFRRVIQEKLKDTKFKKAWNELAAEFEVERALRVELRMRGNATQKNLGTN